MQKFLFSIILFVFSQNLYAQVDSPKEYNLSVTLYNAPFSNLALRDYRDLHSVIIPGRSVGKFKWEFKIPDSIVANSHFMELIIPEKDNTTNSFRQVRFRHERGGLTTSISIIGIQDENNQIEAQYKDSTSYEDENVAYFSGRIDSNIRGTLTVHDFSLIPKDDSSDITVRSHDPYFTWFNSGNNNTSYNEHLQSYISLAKKYSDSRYLITNLSLNLTRFKSRADVQKIYEKLSDKFKNSKPAKRIERYLSDDGKNIKLLNLETQKTEALVQDSSKYGLLIFSASWCGPCIEEMPLLKKLYQQLNKRINFTTISMDDESKVKVFQDLLIKNEISWRTLYALKDQDMVNDLLSVNSIPLTILVYPNGQMERMDIRNPANQKKLLSLIL